MDNSLPRGFEEIEHTADWALRVRGRDLKELLLNAARGMVALMIDRPADLPVEVEQVIELESIDAESLLVDWLSELAFWAETEMIVFHQFDLHHVTPTSLRATVRGGHAPHLKKHIKAVTYHNLEIVQTPQGLETTIVFDV
ncbi:MAG: archease [Chloroflexi bacterium]|nr:MAG: archease [Chloroflexota bacterium]